MVTIGSCSIEAESGPLEVLNDYTGPIQNEAFRDLFKESDLKGSVLIYDLQKNTYYSNDFGWAAQGQLPASTFKIVNSIIGLESGIIDDSVVFKWDGEQKWNKYWMQDLDLNHAFQYSCVSCYIS